MTSKTNTWIAMTAITTSVPASTDGNHPAQRHLVGIGFFVARREDARWHLQRHAHAIPAGDTEGSLLESIVHKLPTSGTLIGWNIDHGLMPLLLDAAATAPPVVAHQFLERLHRLLHPGVVDMAIGNGTASLAATASGMAIYTPTWDADAVFSDWATGQTDRLRQDIADEALAIWLVFLRSAGLAGQDAETATDAWSARRGTCRKVHRPDGAG